MVFFLSSRKDFFLHNFRPKLCIAVAGGGERGKGFGRVWREREKEKNIKILKKPKKKNQRDKIK